MRLSAQGEVLGLPCTPHESGGDAAGRGAGGAVQEALGQLLHGASAPRRAALLRGLDEQLAALRAALGRGCVFQFEASTLRLEADVAAEGGPPSVRLSDFEAPCMRRDAAFGAGLLAALAAAHAAARSLMGADPDPEPEEVQRAAAEPKRPRRVGPGQAG